MGGVENSKTMILMNVLSNYYKNHPDYIVQLKSILEEKDVISLRILDWFATNYTKKNIVLIDGVVDVYQSYKLLLKSYSKKYFDVFRRKEKTLFYYGEGEVDENDEENSIYTSCGQLCFFRWCFENNILEYVRNNIKVIETDMRLSCNKKKRIVNPDEMKKRTTLSLSSSKSMSRRQITYKMSLV